MIHMTMSHHFDDVPEVRHHEGMGVDYAVQVFLGSSYHSMYLSVESARSFAEALLAVLPATEEAGR